MTNLAKAVGAKREDAKVVKVKSVGQFNHATRPVNKENVLVSKDGLARPAQRTVAVANKAKRGLENRANEPNKKLEQAAPRENAVATYAETREALKMQNTNRASHERRGSQKSSLETRPQPRHHKSQPQLKQRQPTLRRTQSRQLERTETILESTSQSVATESQVTSSPETQTDSDGSAPVSVEAASQSVQVENHLEMPSRLPEISEESGVVPANYADGTAPGLSEPEEYWDEDDEDYDDQDQAYTTAHSFRSRDMTTGGPTTLLQPKVSLRIQRELEEARIEVEQTRQPEDIEEEAWDVSMVAEYGEEIFEYMRELEVGQGIVVSFCITFTDVAVSTGQDASQPALHGYPDGDPMVNALSPHGLVGSSPQPIQPPPRDTLPHGELYRSVPVPKDCVHRKAPARWRYCHPRGFQVRGDQLPVTSRDCLYG